MLQEGRGDLLEKTNMNARQVILKMAQTIIDHALGTRVSAH